MNKNNKIPRVRPRFEFTIKYSMNEAIKRITNSLKISVDIVEGIIVDNHVILDIPDKFRHFWSPQMNFRFVKNNEKSADTLVRGIIGPRPAFWTLFIFFYFAIGVLGFLISSYGISKWILGEYSHSLWALPISLLLMATAYLTGKFGERLGKDQIVTLTKFVFDTLKVDIQ